MLQEQQSSHQGIHDLLPNPVWMKGTLAGRPQKAQLCCVYVLSSPHLPFSAANRTSLELLLASSLVVL